MESEKTKNRIEWVDYLKSFAIFLVVLAHLLGSLKAAKIDRYPEITETISYCIRLFCIPLFMCMSGFLYCKTKKEFSWENYKKFELNNNDGLNDLLGVLINKFYSTLYYILFNFLEFKFYFF